MKDLLGLSKSESFIRTRAQYLYTFEISMNAQRDLMVRRAGGNCCSDKCIANACLGFDISYVWQKLWWIAIFGRLLLVCTLG
jgi:hypothetical protein